MSKLHALFSIVVIVVAIRAAPIYADDAAKDQAREHVLAADTDFNLGRYAEALAEYTKAYELYPVPPLLFNLGQCHRHLKNWERAIFFFEGYLRESADATNRDVIEDLIREARGQLDSQRDQALAESRAEAQHHVDAATGAEHAGRFPDALHELTLAYALAPEPQTLRAIADLHGKLGRCADAVPLYHRIIASKPGPTEAASAQQAIDRCRLQPKPPVKQASIVVRTAPWYTDWAGGALATAGVASGVAGVLFYRSAVHTRDRADAAPTFEQYEALLDRSHDRRTLSVAFAAGGAALLGAAVFRYVTADRRREQRVALTPARGGGIVSWDLSF